MSKRLGPGPTEQGRWRWAVPLVAVLLVLGGTGASIKKVAQTSYWLQDTDFALYYLAARAIATGGDPYDHRLYTEGRDPKYYGAVLPKGDPYAYSPVLAEGLCALLPLGKTGVRLAWWLVCWGSIAGSVVLLLRSFGTPFSWSWTFFAMGLLFVGRTVQSDLYHGQANLPLLLALILGLKFMVDGRRYAAAATLAVMFACKPFLGVLLFYLARRREWRTAFLSAAGSAALVAASFTPSLFGGKMSVRGWLDTTHYYSSPPFAARPDNQSLYGLFVRLFSSENNPFTIPWLDEPGLVTGLVVVLIVPLAWVVLDVLQRGPIDGKGGGKVSLLLDVGILYALTLALGPLTQGDYLLFLLPGFAGIVLVTRSLWHEPSGSRSRWLLACAVWFVAFLPMFLPWRFHWGLAKPDEWSPISGWRVLLTGRIGLSFLVSGVVLLSLVRRERRQASPA